jgi:hypothetical protein
LVLVAQEIIKVKLLEILDQLQHFLAPDQSVLLQTMVVADLQLMLILMVDDLVDLVAEVDPIVPLLRVEQQLLRDKEILVVMELHLEVLPVVAAVALVEQELHGHLEDTEV